MLICLLDIYHSNLYVFTNYVTAGLCVVLYSLQIHSPRSLCKQEPGPLRQDIREVKERNRGMLMSP